MHVTKQGTHAADLHETVDAEGGREEPRNGFPKRRHGARRPRNARNEQQWHRGKHKHDDEHLTIMGNARNGHAEEHTRQQIWEQKRHQISPMAYLNQMEQARHHTKDIGRNHHIDSQISRSFAQKHFDGPFSDDVRFKDAPAFLLALLPCHHTNAQYHRLLD